MKTIGFPINDKENENRRAVLPTDIKSLGNLAEYLYFEQGYGKILGIDDEEFEKIGCHICTKEEVLKKDIIIDPKIGDAKYLKNISEGHTVFGWIHATQNKNIADIIVENKLTAIAWEKMYKKGRHIFWRNNELAGEAAVLHAFQCFGQMPYDTKVAVLGTGNTARGAIKILNMLGADVTQYAKNMEELFKEEMFEYDVIVNAILWDVTRTDHIIYKEDLKKFKKNTMIIDISCDRNGGIETSIPTTIEKPTYIVDDVMHYVVDHTPALYFKTFTANNSRILMPYIEQLIKDELGETLKASTIIKDGIIVDHEIIDFQRRDK